MTTLHWKSLAGIALAIAVVEGFSISSLEKREVHFASNTFSYFGGPSDNYVSIKGKWTPDTFRLASTQLDCWRDKGVCIEASSFVSDGMLGLERLDWNITKWTADEIVSRDDSARCAINTLRIDRKGKLAITTSTPRQPKPNGCDIIPNTPMVLYLSDGSSH